MQTAPMTAANLVTILRVFMVPIVAIALVEGWYASAFWLFIVAGLSDGVDGAIARLFDQRSELGAMLDPLADKVLLVTVFAMLGYMEVLPLWLVVLVVSRDLVIVGGVALADWMGEPLPMRPHPVSKANTAAQIALATLALASLAWSFESGGWMLAGIYGVAGLTIASLGAYTRVWIAHLNGQARPGDG